jgi:hypothetical protein
LFHTARSGLAIHIEEYVPAIIPTVSARAKSLRAVVPSIRSKTTGNNVVREVFMDLDSVAFIVKMNK